MRTLDDRTVAAWLENNTAREEIVDPPVFLCDIFSDPRAGTPLYRAVQNREVYRLGTRLYQQKPFIYQLPQEGERNLARGSLTIFGENGIVREMFDRLLYKPYVRVQVVQESNQVVVWDTRGTAQNIQVDKDKISFVIENSQDMDKRFSRVLFDRTTTPSIYV